MSDMCHCNRRLLYSANLYIKFKRSIPGFQSVGHVSYGEDVEPGPGAMRP